MTDETKRKLIGKLEVLYDTEHDSERRARSRGDKDMASFFQGRMTGLHIAISVVRELTK